MTNTQKFAQQELDILAATVPDAIVTPFAKEILALCEAFGNSGQSGGSAPYTASAISQAVKKLLLQEPICDVTGHENEWVDVSEMGDGSIMYQNSRCSALLTVSLHYSKECAEKAMQEHKQKELDKFNEMYANDNELGFKFGEYEDWCVQPIEVLP